MPRRHGLRAARPPPAPQATLMRERFRPADYRFIAVCLLLLALTVWFSARNFHYAFPEASIDFRVNREEARAIAARFLAARGYGLADYRHAASFTYDDNAKTFLEREAGLERANRIMGSRVRLWRWSNRWFRPQQKEEFRADVTPGGELVAFEHEIAEAAPRSSLSPEQARAAAEEFLRTVMRRDPAALTFVEGSVVARPARTDQVFTWKERDFDLRDSSYRIEVTILGSEIGACQEYLKVPEQWSRDYERLRSRNEVAQMVDTAAMLLLIVGMLVSLVYGVRRHNVRWGRASTVGVIGGALFFLSSWNQFPLTEFNYPTTDSYASFAARQMLNSLLGALAAAGVLFVITAAAEPAYREAFGGRISLGNLFRPAALRTRSFFLGTVLGLSLTGIFIAYQTAFYMTAFRFGAWSPADVPYSDLLNTRFPWAFVLLGGFLPAVSEEFIFRMFAIPWLARLFRSRWPALVVAGFLWGFGHSGYPQQPFFIRGVEVGIGGVALGLIMLRWGILPTLVWHYSVDALYSALLLMRSSSLYFKLSGAASAGIMVLPAVIALVLYFREGGFAPETGLTNDAEPAPPPEPPLSEAAGAEAVAAAPAVHVRWSTPRRIAALAIFTAGTASLLIPMARIGDTPRYQLGAAQARAAADGFLRAQGADPTAFRHVDFPAASWDGDDELAAKYLLERRPAGWVAARFHDYRPIQHWTFRYFKPLDKEEFLVSVHPETGRVLGFSHSLPEDRAGADLAPEAARAVATSWAGAHGWNLDAMDLKETASEKRKARRDYTLVWEAGPGDARSLDQARYRLHLQVDGDQVTAERAYWKLPEDWVRTRSRQNVVSITVSVVKIAVVSIAVIVGLLVLARATRQGSVRWGSALRLSIPFTLLAAGNAALTYRTAWRNYSTAMPAETFQAILLTTAVTSLIFIFLGMCALAALLQALQPEAFRAFRADARRAAAGDALLAVLAAIGLAVLAGQAKGLLLDRFHAAALFSVRAPEVIASAAPAVSALSSAARAVLGYSAALALVLYALSLFPKRRLAVAAALVAVVATVPGEARTAGEFALHLGAGAFAPAAVALFCFAFARRNYLAYALAAWTLALRAAAVELFGQPNSFLQAQGWILVAVLAASLLWCVRPVIGRALD